MLQNLPFPSLKAYAELVRAFQKSIWPQTGSFFSSQQHNVAQGFKFATGHSQKQPLSVAIVDCIDQLQQRLGFGVHPNFCQLLVTLDPYGNHISLAPTYVQEIFGSYGLQPPVLIGGAVSELVANPSWPGRNESLRILSESCQGVSIMAASLPGVEIHPFRAENSSLPNLPWAELLKSEKSERLQSHSRNAAFLLAEPHFHDVNEFTARLQGVMPDMPIIGGIVRSSGWGTEHGRERSKRGAIYLNDQTFDSGAVGCILSGDMQVDALCTEGCRPVGPCFSVTGVQESRGKFVIMELDGKPAFAAVVEAQKSCVAAMDQLLELKVGLDVTGTGEMFQQIPPFSAVQGGIYIGNLDCPIGSLVQLHVKDSTWGQEQLEKKMQAWLETRPEDFSHQTATELGMLLYSCSGVSHAEQAAVQQLQKTLSNLTFQGCKVDGEISYDPDIASKTGANCLSPAVKSFCSSFGILRQTLKPAK